MKKIFYRIEGYGAMIFDRILTKAHIIKGGTECMAIFNFRSGIATTFNQAQGRTLKNVMIDTSNGYLYPAQFYCGASRVRASNALHFTYLPERDMSSLESVINPDPGAINELQRWKDYWRRVELPSDVPNTDEEDEKKKKQGSQSNTE